MAEKRRDAWRPTPEQELLMHAAMDEGNSARRAWEQWIATADIERLDPGSFRLLPLLYRNLLKLKIEHPAIPRFSDSYRRVWATNQLALRHLGEVVAQLEKHGIRTMVLKGAAMMARYYEDIGTRPMADFDVLVPFEKTDEAMALLVELGWVGEKPLHLLTSDYRTPLHGIGFRHAKMNLGFDLHWHIMHMHLAPLYDVPMWEAAVPLTIGKVATRMLCAEHQLAHIFFNGCINEGSVNLRWLPDALILLRNEPALDWGRLLAHCQWLELTPPVVAMLEYLHISWDVAVPAEALVALRQTPVSYRMRQVYATLNTRKQERSGMQVFWLLYTQYQLSQPQNSRLWPLGFIQFLRQRWSLDGVGRTMRYAIARTRGMTAEKAKQIA